MNATPLLHSERLDLEPVRASHAQEAWPLVDDERMWRYFPEKRPSSLDALRRLYQKWECGSRQAGEIWHNWMCRERVSGTLAGGMQSTIIERGRCALIAYAIYPAFQRRGYAREASLAVIEYVRNAYTVERICAEMDIRNEASYRLAESLGFVRVGEESGEYRYERAVQ
ncbi:MAG TPA: GNAT family N-acetyltransferase [Candidatus Baltobacteraceae bacterium]